MRPIVLTQAGVGSSNPAPMDIYLDPFNVGMGVTTTGTVTYTVQHTFDDPFPIAPLNQAQYNFSALTPKVSTAPTTGIYSGANTNGSQYVTVNSATAGIAIGNQIAFGINNTAPVLTVIAVDVTTISGQTAWTVFPALSQTVANGATIYQVTPASPSAPVLNWFNHPSLALLTANSDGNYAFPVRAIRINVSAGTGQATLTIVQAGIT